MLLRNLAHFFITDAFPANSKYAYIADLASTLFLFLFLATSWFQLPVTASYFFFFSALIITLHTDINFMLISRFVTLYSIPVALLLALCGWLPITLASSIFGAASGYVSLWATAYIFYRFTKKEGMGQGDIDLIAFIGAFTGFAGWWSAMLLGSCTASVYGLATMVVTKNYKSTKMPFGPFLVFGAIVFVVMQDTIINWFFAL